MESLGKISPNSAQVLLEGPKEFTYFDPQVNIGKGKHGPIDLIIVKHQLGWLVPPEPGKPSSELRALKRISKLSCDNPKRIEHVKNEKRILRLLQ